MGLLPQDKPSPRSCPLEQPKGITSRPVSESWNRRCPDPVNWPRATLRVGSRRTHQRAKPSRCPAPLGAPPGHLEEGLGPIRRGLERDRSIGGSRGVALLPAERSIGRSKTLLRRGFEADPGTDRPSNSGPQVRKGCEDPSLQGGVLRTASPGSGVRDTALSVPVPVNLFETVSSSI